MRKTKIIATLGPSTDKDGMLQKILESGADVIRFNMSHGDHAQHAARMTELRNMSDKLGLPVAAIMDTKGPEIRTGIFPQPVELKEGQKYTLTTRQVEGNDGICSISYDGLPKDISVGQLILVDDGLVGMVVDAVVDTEIICTVQNSGRIASNKGINCPDMHFSMPYVSDRDRADLVFGKEQDFDYIAASFVRSADDIAKLRAELDKIGWTTVKIISKIENAEGVSNIDEIINCSDAIMVARGDMGVEIALEELPGIQKDIIKKTITSGKQVITATQMLESMIKNPRPTRAEVTDIANAIYDGTSAIMLSGETAAGNYPVESVETMARIAEGTEANIDYRKRFHEIKTSAYEDITTAISHATVMTAHDLNVASIVTVTESGWTARMVSRFRPLCPIIAGTSHKRVWRQMNLSWGVVPVRVDEKEDTTELFDAAVAAAKQSGLVKSGDTVVITAGVPLGETGNTNLLKVQEVR